MKKFLCQTCESPLKIKEGDFIFSFDINCDNEHKLKNIDLDDLLSMRKITNNENLFLCKIHKKKNKMHCFDCDEDICFFCYQESHKLHKLEYIKNQSLNSYEIFTMKNHLDREKKTIDTFLNELKDFQNKFNLYLKILEKDIKNYHKFRNELYNDISQNTISYIDYNNTQKCLNNTEYIKIIDYANNFINCETLLKRYNHLKDIFELLFKKGKYIDEQNIKSKYNTYKKMEIIPINNKYFFNLEKYNLEIAKNNTNFNSKGFEYEILLEIDKVGEDYDIVLKHFNKIEKNLSFYILKYIKRNNNIIKTELFEINIKDLKDLNNNGNKNYNIKKIKTFEEKINLLILSENKYIVDNYKNIILYDNSLVKKEIINLNSYINSFMKINKNLFVCINSKKKEIYAIKIEEDFIDYNTIKNCGERLIYYSKNKKILFSEDTFYLYMINFNSAIPEVIQKIEFRYNNKNNYYNYLFINKYITNLINCFDFYNDDSICGEVSEIVFKDYSKYDVTYLIQYKIVEYELVEISKIVLNSKIIENEYIYKYNN